MSECERDYTVEELQARWDKIRIANIYDTLDKMGYINQCVDLGIRPLFPRQHVAGKAITARGSRDPRNREEIRAEREQKKDTGTLVSIRDLCYQGCILVIETGGEPWTGKFGEMTSWNIQQAGCRGIVMDGMIRDWLGLEAIPNFGVCARGTSPVESAGRWGIKETNVPIALPGTLTSQVGIRPGDWVVGGPDGVIVIPEDISMEALIKAEEIEGREQGMREDFATGMSFKDAYAKWGRA